MLDGSHTEKKKMSMAYIRKTYGVPAKRGGRVEYTGEGRAEYGTIKSANGAHLAIKLDGVKHTMPFHPTWCLRYLPPNREVKRRLGIRNERHGRRRDDRCRARLGEGVGTQARRRRTHLEPSMTTITRIIAASIAAAVLAGCASTAQIYSPIVDPKVGDQSKLLDHLEECRALAGYVDQPNTAAAGAVAGALFATAIGAMLGLRG